MNLKSLYEDKAENYDGILYRGQGDAGWKIESTLYRFLKKCGRSKGWCYFSQYFDSVRSVLNIHNLDVGVDFPEASPFLVGPILPPQFKDQAAKLIYAYAELRHYDVPSPVIDWTLNPLKAAFFAFYNAHDNQKQKAIFSIKKKKNCSWDYTKPTAQDFDHFYVAERCFPEGSTPMNARHFAQESCYTIVLHNDKWEHLGPPNINKFNPHMSLSINDSSFSLFETVQYVIRDSEQQDVALNILEELKENDITQDKLLVKPSKIPENVINDFLESLARNIS